MHFDCIICDIYLALKLIFHLKAPQHLKGSMFLFINSSCQMLGKRMDMECSVVGIIWGSFALCLPLFLSPSVFQCLFSKWHSLPFRSALFKCIWFWFYCSVSLCVLTVVWKQIFKKGLLISPKYYSFTIYLTIILWRNVSLL